MDKIRSVIGLSIYNLKKWITNPRIYILFILLLCYSHYVISPVKDFAQNVNIPVTPYIMPFFISSTYTGKLLLIGVVLLFCDAPFVENDHPYLILRSGRSRWYLGQFCYIMIGSALYTLILMLVSVLVLFPQVSFSLEWGKVISTFVQTGIAAQHGIPIDFNIDIYLKFSPIMAMAVQFLLCWLTCAMIGNIIFFVNTKISREAGIITAITIVLLQEAAEVTGIKMLIYYSPTSWISFTKLSLNDVSGYPSISAAVSILVIIIIVFAILSYFSVRKKDIEIHKPI